MDEITLINLLNKICDTKEGLSWSLSCKFQQENGNSMMEIDLYDTDCHKSVGSILFSMESGKVIKGRHKSMLPFPERTSVTDALLEIVHFESLRITMLPN